MAAADLWLERLSSTTRSQGWREEMFAEASKTHAVHGPVQNHRSTRSIQGHSVHQGISLPVASGNSFHQALATFGPAADSGHLGLQSRFVDEHEPLGVNLLLTVAPVRTPLSDVLAILFGRP
jgi:hypothetical protein